MCPRGQVSFEAYTPLFPFMSLNNTPPLQTINILHTESSPSLGGQELRILLEMEAMAERGFCSVLAARPDTPIVHEAKQRGLLVYEVPMRFNLEPSSLWQLGSIIKKHDIHILNTHNSKDGWNAAPVARLLGARVIRARHIANPIRASKSSKLIYGPLCDAVMTTSESIKAHLVERGIPAVKICSVPTGVDIDRFKTAQPGSLRADLGIPADVPLIGQIAVMRGNKGPGSFVKAAQIAIGQGCPAWFVLVGDGPARSKVEAQLAEGGYGDRIKLAGFRQDIPAILADLDIFVLAAHVAEGVPQAVLQAQAASKPIVTTECGGINEVALHDQTAYTVPPRDPEALAKAIMYLLNHPEEAARLARNGHALVEQKHTLNHMLDEMEALYRGLLEAP